MTDVFSGSEVIELGIQIEKNGRDFYTTLFKNSKDKGAKKIFEFLATEEEKHIQNFKEILNSAHQYEPVASYPQEYFSYMNSLASEQVFTKPNRGEEIAKSVGNDKEAVRLAMGFEKDSIAFYEGIKKIVPESQREVINKVIAQEEEHMQQLLELDKIL